MVSKAQIRAVDRYNKAKTKTLCIRLNTETDKDIIDILDQVDSKQGYIKNLIRSDNR